MTNLKWLLGSLHWPTIEDFIERTPQYLTREATNFFDEAKGIVESTLFHIYDPVLKVDILEFFQEWRESMRYDHYTPTANGRLYRFTSSHSSYANEIEKEKEHWEHMQAARLKLHAAMTKLLADVRDKFPEIDIQHESRETGRRYDAQMAEIESPFPPLKGMTAKKKKKKAKKK